MTLHRRSALTLLLAPAILPLLRAEALAQTDVLGGAGKLLQGFGLGQRGLSVAEVAAGLKEALSVGSGRVVSQLGKVGGFMKDPAIKIPLPGALQSVQKALSAVGAGGLANDLQARLNRAAEVASGKAKPLFLDAVQKMTFDDAVQIWKGPQDAATQYFKRQMTPGLTDTFRPEVQDGLAKAGAVKAYDKMMGRYEKLPFVPDAKADLTDYTVEKGLAGLFHYLGKEEASIRQNPGARSTELLRKVFG